MADSRKFNWGILGTSFISGVMADAIIEEGSTCLYAVAGRSKAPLDEFASKYDVKHVYSSNEELIADGQVDIIYIALPNHLHHKYVVMAANAGKAILCEKSLSVDMGKTYLALEAVKENNVFFAEGLMYLTHPLATAIRDVIKTGTIGEIKSITGQYCAPIAQFVNADGKGALYNLGCYPASLLHLIMQQAFGNDVFDTDNYQVVASGRKGADGNICETAATVRFVKENVVCQLHTAEDYGLHALFTVLGSKGSLVTKSNPWLPESKGNAFIVVSEYEKEGETVNVSADGNGFLYQVRAVREALEKGEKYLQRPAVTPSDSREIMQFLVDWERATKTA
eukprot:CFRG6041T1